MRVLVDRVSLPLHLLGVLAIVATCGALLGWAALSGWAAPGFAAGAGLMMVLGLAACAAALGVVTRQVARSAGLPGPASGHPLTVQALAGVAHEFRSPLGAIVSSAELLRDGPTVREQRDDLVRTIERSAGHLLALVNDILDLARAQSGQMTVERIAVSPRALVEDAVDMFRAEAQRKGLTLRTCLGEGLPAAIHTDPLRLRQILVNLVGNAVKFTPAGGITVAAEPLSASAGPARIRFSVADTGIGMTPSQVKRLFTPFVQGNRATPRQFGGTGLGLAVSQRLAGLLGGAISIVSHPGRGTTATLELQAPVGDAPERAFVVGSETRQAPATVLRGIRVLLVEDGPDNQRLIRAVLQAAGAHVRIVENGRDAIEALVPPGGAAVSADVVLMDVQLPMVDGLEATRRLREHGYAGPIIGLSACAGPDDRRRCLEAGCNDYLVKPVPRALLVDAVGRWASASEPRARAAA